MTLEIPCRYYRVFTDLDVPCVEANFHHVERLLSVPVGQAALVLVDVWSTHYIDSWLERAAQVTREKIVPVLEAARQVGMCVVHAPSPAVAARYGVPERPAPSAGEKPQWPPDGFRSVYRSGAFSGFGRGEEPRLGEVWTRYSKELDIAEPVRPLSGEAVIGTGDELEALLAGRGILHLFYAGFATNWCVLLRDYGVLAMEQAGYNIILLRDATTGVEFHDTVHDLAATRIAVREIETKHGWSAASADFVAACAR